MPDRETTAAQGARRSRSLPAGVHPVQDRARRRQVQLQDQAAELYAIYDSEPENDQTPMSFAMVEPEAISDL